MGVEAATCVTGVTFERMAWAVVGVGLGTKETSSAGVIVEERAGATAEVGLGVSVGI